MIVIIIIIIIVVIIIIIIIQIISIIIIIQFTTLKVWQRVEYGVSTGQVYNYNKYY